jgi:hypothetical protein
MFACVSSALFLMENNHDFVCIYEGASAAKLSESILMCLVVIKLYRNDIMYSYTFPSFHRGPMHG